MITIYSSCNANDINLEEMITLYSSCNAKEIYHEENDYILGFADI